MVEPVTTITTLAIAGLVSVARNAANGVIGNVSDRVLGDVIAGTRERVQGLGLPENHDVARAVRTAQIHALERVIRDYRAAGRPEWVTAPYTHPNAFFDGSLAFCERAIGRWSLRGAELSLQVTAPLVGALDGLLAPHAVPLEGTTLVAVGPPTARRSVADGLAQLADDAVLEELLDALPGVGLPTDFEQHFRCGTVTHQSFRALFAAYIGEQMKINPRFRDIFVAGQLAMLRQFAAATQDAATTIDARTARIEAHLEALLEALRLGDLFVAGRRGPRPPVDEPGDDEVVSTVVVALEHAVPYYQPEHLQVRDSGERFFVAVPAAWRERLRELGFDSPSQTVFGAGDDLTALDRGAAGSGLAAVPGLAARIAAHGERVAEAIWGELDRGNVRFNGEMFAPRRVRPNRTAVDEKAVFSMYVYRTNYFTYRVLRGVYQELRAQGHDLDLTPDFESYNRYAMFTASFGICCFLIVDDGSGDEVLLCRRSPRLAADPGKWHFSMNEAFSVKDVDGATLANAPSLKVGLFRGLDEELALRWERLVPASWRFTDVFVGTDRCEMGILCHARLEFSPEYTRADFVADRSTAQDVTLETVDYRFVSMGEIPRFLSAHRDEISIGCAWGLRTLISRYNRGYVE